MTRWLPFPRLSVLLLVLWLLLNQSLAPAHLLLGAVLGVGVPLAFRNMLPEGQGPRRPSAAFRLLGIVLLDILRSNLTVAQLITYRRHRRVRASFLFIPLELSNPNALTLLSLIVTSTPGTLWVDYDTDERVLLLHVLDMVDEDAWVYLIKYRYERLLLEVFE